MSIRSEERERLRQQRIAGERAQLEGMGGFFSSHSAFSHTTRVVEGTENDEFPLFEVQVHEGPGEDLEKVAAQKPIEDINYDLIHVIGRLREIDSGGDDLEAIIADLDRIQQSVISLLK